MANLAVCRVCLSANIRMHILVNTPLQEVFEKLTNITLTSLPPPILCYMCYSYLRKCRMFMLKALKVDQLLNQLFQSGIQITEKSLSSLDRHNINGTLYISPVEHVDVEAAPDLKLNADNHYIKLDQPDKHEEGTMDDDNMKHVGATDLKFSRLIKFEKEESIDAESNLLDDDHHTLSDSEDDVPLKKLKSRQDLTETKDSFTKVKKCVKVKKKRKQKDENMIIGDFAREILLTKEEQIEELLGRTKSLNYLNSPFKCSLCYKGFVDARAYENHKEKHDERSGPHECEICRMRYRTVPQLRTHHVSAHYRHYACIQCGHRSHTANHAREHEKWHRGHTYECKLCGHKCRKPTSYLSHMRKRHPTQYVCNVCGDSFVTRHGLLMHNTKSHRRGDEPPEDSSEAAKRFCAECNIQFLSTDAWKRHLLSSIKHTQAGENSLACRICPTRCPSTATLKIHLKQHRKELNAIRSSTAPVNIVAELTCDECGSRFSNKSRLNAHIKRTHLGLKYNKNIVCEVCGKKCTSNATLKYHQRTHTGERPFQCSVCQKRFSDNNHLRIHHRIHTGERPYSCAVCARRFAQKPALNRHYRVHTGVKPYICQFCSKTFSQTNSLKLHVKTVHFKQPQTRRKNVEITPKVETVTLQAL